MKILGISTSSNIATVCLSEDDTVIKELNIDNTKTHSETLVPLIDSLLKETTTKLSEINLLACDIGPGSFTGIRIGIATIKAISQSLNVPIVEVSSLEALAYNVQTDGMICSLIDARNSQVYMGIFDKEYNLQEKYFADDINILLDVIKKYENLTFVGDGAILHQDILNGNIYKESKIHAKAINECGYNKYKLGIYKDADTLGPMYLRKSQAERMKDLNG